MLALYFLADFHLCNYHSHEWISDTFIFNQFSSSVKKAKLHNVPKLSDIHYLKFTTESNVLIKTIKS